MSPPPAAPRLRVAYVVPPSSHFAGIERVTHDLASGLAEQFGDELEVHVVYASRYDEPTLRQPAYKLHQLGVDQLRQLPVALRRWVVAHPVDVLVVPQVEASVLAWLGTRGAGLPALVVYLHGNPRVEYDGGNWSTRLLFLIFRAVVARRVAGVLAVSPSLRDYTATHLAPHVPVVYAPNPVRPVDARVRKGVDATFHFVTLGRLARQKGHDVLLEAFALARDRMPLARLSVVGSGAEDGALRGLSRRLGLDDVVTFAGYRTEPGELLGQANCFVLASRWEGFGVALVEALRVGLPLLATDCDFGPADIVSSDRIGELVPPDDPTALADGLVRAAGRPADPAAEQERRDLAATFDRHVVAIAHRQVLHDLTSSLLAGAPAHGH